MSNAKRNKALSNPVKRRYCKASRSSVKSKPTPCVKLLAANSLVYSCGLLISQLIIRCICIWAQKKHEKAVASDWDLLSVDDKEYYRTRIRGSTLEQGKDVYRVRL